MLLLKPGGKPAPASLAFLSQSEIWRLAAEVQDVSTPPKARLAGLSDYPGFDLFSKRSGEERGIEVKGRVGTGAIELTENEWARAINERERYWL